MLRLDEDFPLLNKEKRPEREEEVERAEEQPVVDKFTTGLSLPHNIKDRNKGVGLKL